MMFVREMFGHKAVSFVLAGVFAISAHFFFKACDVYLANKHTLQILAFQRQRLEVQRERQAEKRRTLDSVSKFLDHADSIGLVPSQWVRYDVSIEEAVSFEEAENILEETVNTDSYYFEPRLVHVKTALSDGEEKGRASQAHTGSRELGGKDMWLDLKGAFVVSNRR